MTLVVDASVAAEYLLRTPLGLAAAPELEQAVLIAPELLDAEMLAILRKAVLGGRLSERRARSAVGDLRDWGVERVSHTRLLEIAWSLRHNVTAYDAMYLATARLYHAAVLTADGPLARAPRTGVPIRNIRL